MTRPRTFSLSVASIAILLAQSMSTPAQTPVSLPSQGPSIAISLAIEKNQIPVGQKPLAIVIIRNISQQNICFSTASNLYRVHIEGKAGEAPETEYKRHLHGDFRPGDGPGLDDGPVVCQDIAPGASVTHTYDLTLFYELSMPGKYSIYMDVRDEPKSPNVPSVWLRTNTAQFEVLAPAQQPW